MRGLLVGSWLSAHDGGPSSVPLDVPSLQDWRDGRSASQPPLTLDCQHLAVKSRAMTTVNVTRS
ncbi:hypothetical protein CC85DRAFT_285336 [Cutaneotrichosporon oleaginosum]|uniref:Uncharacterized protein n=1 Tax=Cutaneotrichosporon oleaginosum TaxID=879819 RepID=A0A0J0XNE7_9TREE|nr:uncharacterized protein CC85DRAFT_285336 [Cutaneotrichosporon oleaginosum]KLT42603.1 hypothetical protein CC85DRAFT_285336 [Cutaneotrichosporon oleaginosum]TXT05280.1 hypothetical protein COLE_06600 [Cutaneotrichosporon oleaginosum]